ncbi:phage tail tape measure protein [Deinococcus gobiensis]|uniref:Phage tail tape measure protein, family, core region domain protein n=1 Tax=Deinococcus gobiensis (strain DSM 21396 / JCM 16679 / CGMCC 1.7299 / I-0) TaxID=745776 RepID=H8GXR3_DEIGI|nr:phage tail tape measure protein [Deinococcus gobiensis]AFD25915.1 Phage tail tape measure protein, family, core region domain protein [Deinococcus gobiensis I-0]
MTLPDLKGTASLDITDFRKGIAQMQGDLQRLQAIAKSAGTIKITTDLRAAKQTTAEVDQLRAAATRPIKINADGSGLRDTDRAVRELAKSVKATRDLWQTQVITDDEAALSAQRLRNELLKLAAAEDTSAETLVKATQAAAQAQRTMDQARGEVTKGGFAANAALGILDALGNLGGPAGAAAAQIGNFITQGLTKGIDQGKRSVADESGELSDEVVQALKRKLRIQSPSVVMTEIGEFIVQGLIKGFKSDTDTLLAVVRRTGEQVPDAFKAGAGDGQAGGALAGLTDNLKSATDAADALAPSLGSAGEAVSLINDATSELGSGLAPVAEGLLSVGTELAQGLTAAGDAAAEVAPQADEAAAGLEDVAGAAQGVVEGLAPVGESLAAVGQEMAAGLGLAGDAAANAAPQVAAVGNSAEETASAAENLTAGLAPLAAGVLAFGAALTAALPKAAEFQTAMQAIAAESDLTATDLKNIGDGLLEVSNNVGVSAVALAKASFDLVGAGVRGAESNAAIVELARQAAELATAGMSDISSSADILSSALNAFNLSASSATRVSDIFIQTVNTGKISLEQIGSTMGEVFPKAAKLGVSLESLSASVATLTSVGVPAEQAVTGINSALDSILGPTTEASKAAAELGIGFDAATLKAKGLPQFLRDVATAANGSTAIMAELFGSTEAVNAVFALTSDVGAKKFTEALEKMAHANGATAEGFRDASNTYEHAQAKFTASVDNLQIAFASRFLPSITKATDGVSKFVQSLDEIGSNGAVQFVAIVGTSVVLANTFLKLSAAAKAAVGSTALFTAVANAGGLSAYIAGLGGIAGAMTLVTGATVAATVAAAPLLTVALAVGVALSGWKLGKLIGEMKLFGDETTTLNDKLTDFFAVTLFGADKDLIQQMREGEEAEQRRQLSLERTGQAATDTAAAIRATAAAEAAAVAEQNRAAAAREAEINKIRSQKAALEDLATTLEGRQFTLKLAGKSDLQRELAELKRDFDDLAQKAQDAFAGDLKNPKLLTALKQLRTQQAAEEAAARKTAADRAAATAGDAALAVQKAEIAALADGRAKKKVERALELQEFQKSVDDQVAALSDFPKRQAEIQAAGRAQAAAMRKGWAREDAEAAKEDAKRAAEETKAAARVVADAESAGRDALIAGIADETARRRAERDAQLSDLQDSIDAQVAEVAKYPDKVRKIQEAGRTREKGMRQQYANEDAEQARDTAQRIADAWAKAQDAAYAAQAAGRDNDLAQFELTLSRRLAGAKDNALALAQIEAQAVQERARLAQQSARDQYAADRQQLGDARDRALASDKLSDGERQAIWREYYSNLTKLSTDFQTGETARLQKQEEDARAAAEKIRLARIAAAVRPAEDAGRDVSAIQAQQQLAQSAAERLALEIRIQGAQERQAAAYAAMLARAKELGLTDEERTSLGDKLLASNNAVRQSQQAQLDLQKQIKGEAQQIVDLYGRLVVLTGRESGAAAAQRELAEATTQVGDAYARTLPYLDAYRAGSLRPQDYALAGEALGGLVSALEAQRQKLEALRSEYDRQRDALKSVQDVLKGFGEELGDQRLLDNAITFNQATYDQAKAALDTLLKGGQYDAAQLAEATGKLQTSYTGLKDAVAALGEARAREFEREAKRIKDESDRRTRLLDAQIKAAKTAGLDTSGLESQRDAIVADAERQVRGLEAKAEAARTAAQTALNDRTRGLQTLLQGVQQGAATAQKGVTDLAGEVKQAEKDVQDSADRMRKSLEGTFAGLPILAGKAGKTAGQQFAEQFLAGVKSLKLPALSAAAPATAATRPAVGSITQIITINGQNVTGTASQTTKQLLKALANEAEAECRRRGQ